MPLIWRLVSSACEMIPWGIFSWRIQFVSSQLTLCNGIFKKKNDVQGKIWILCKATLGNMLCIYFQFFYEAILPANPPWALSCSFLFCFGRSHLYWKINMSFKCVLHFCGGSRNRHSSVSELSVLYAEDLMFKYTVHGRGACLSCWIAHRSPCWPWMNLQSDSA